MRKKTLNKEIRRSISGSLGRFISIFSLMLLGTFAFVGLKDSEIALDYLYDGQYKIGQTIDFTPPKSKDSDLIKNHSFKIVGFVKSSEYVDKSDFGSTTVGTGKLNGYALVTKEAFDSDVYM